jgi:hypothetical protein
VSTEAAGRGPAKAGVGGDCSEEGDGGNEKEANGGMANEKLDGVGDAAGVGCSMS